MKILIILILSVIVGYNLIDDFDPRVLMGKNVIITGASMGIGEQMAYHYARMGSNLLLTSRSEGLLQQVVKRCKELGRSDGLYLYHVADMSDMTATNAVIKVGEEKLGGIDYLVLNHILPTQFGEWLGTSDNLTILRNTVDINFHSYAHLASHALPSLTRNAGSIIVVSTVAGRNSQPYAISYSTSKFALEGFFSGLRQELHLRNIDVSITLCVIGLIGTNNAIRSIEKFNAVQILRWVPQARAEDAALAIIKGGAVRAREIYFPYLSSRFATILNNVAPRLMERLQQFLYSRE